MAFTEHTIPGGKCTVCDAPLPTGEDMSTGTDGYDRRLHAQRDALLVKQGELQVKLERLLARRDNLVLERDDLLAERDRLLERLRKMG